MYKIFAKHLLRSRYAKRFHDTVLSDCESSPEEGNELPVGGS